MLIEIITPENFLLEEWTAAMIIKDKAIELLEEEKRQIMDAWNDGFYGLEAPETQSAEQYYNQTYNNENDTTDTTAKGL